MSSSSGPPSACTSIGLVSPVLANSVLEQLLLDQRVLQEVLAMPGQVCTAAAFGLALLAQRLRASGQRASAQTSAQTGAREIAWLQQEAAVIDAGEPLGQGLAAFGIEPARLIFVRLRTERDVLRAALEAARCSALGAVVIELVKPIDLTASRRLKLAAEKSGVPLLLLRHPGTLAFSAASNAAPNAAQVRWQVGAAPSAPIRSSTHLPARGEPSFDVPPAFDGPIVFDVTVLKHPAGLSQTRFLIEWDRDRHVFAPALPRPVAAIPAGRPLAA